MHASVKLWLEKPWHRNAINMYAYYKKSKSDYKKNPQIPYVLKDMQKEGRVKVKKEITN